jgi:hypothetical protein
VIILVGSRNREIELASGQFHCPQCNGTRLYKRKRCARYFALYFIPLIQIENLGEFVQCQTCHQAYPPEVLNPISVAADDQMVRAVRRELEIGMPIHRLQKKLTMQNIEEGRVLKIIHLATQGQQTTCTQCHFSYLATTAFCTNCGHPLS